MTLIELLVVLAFIAILASISIPRFKDMVDRAKLSAAEQELSIATRGIWFYQTQNDSLHFPDTVMINSYQDLRVTVKDYVDWPPEESRAKFTFVSYASDDTSFTLIILARDSDRTQITATNLGVSHP